MSESAKGRALPESDRELQMFLDDPQFVHYVGSIIPARPGVRLFLVKLEYLHFNPWSPRNEQFQLRLFNWQFMRWAMASIPIVERHLAEEVARECSVRIADGVPTLISAGRIEKFPASNERVFSLENTSKHPVYDNDAETDLIVEEAEQREIERIIAEYGEPKI